MARKQWLLLGALGTIFGMIVKLVKGRREESAEASRWQSPPSSD